MPLGDRQAPPGGSLHRNSRSLMRRTSLVGINQCPSPGGAEDEGNLSDAGPHLRPREVAGTKNKGLPSNQETWPESALASLELEEEGAVKLKDGDSGRGLAALEMEPAGAAPPPVDVATPQGRRWLLCPPYLPLLSGGTPGSPGPREQSAGTEAGLLLAPWLGSPPSW
ncbi:hypothetical protein NDU88_004345 [Pleurodeles waltl]|uniref:Uncharacterized protein n=1 Tax=Pleurodeles waltl TaxID=8319 RepID=A0AAV7NKR6_PLEWA|nr:hypothetical protein NDU88_004345 [Pleurodeles waltl]